MVMKLSYRQRLSLWFALLFSLVAGAFVFIAAWREYHLKTQILERELEVYAQWLSQGASQGTIESKAQQIVPQHIRISLISPTGELLYDNTLPSEQWHTSRETRSEVVQAREQGKGLDIRLSQSTGTRYLYYARYYSDYCLRLAMPYDIRMRDFLSIDNIFLYNVLVLFSVMLLLVYLVSQRFSHSISQLLHLSAHPQAEVYFSDDELGKIGERIATHYRHLEEGRERLHQEREKLLRHVHSLEEGVCFFSSTGEVEFYNGLYLQYIHLLLDKELGDIGGVLEEPLFTPLRSFVHSYKGEGIHHQQMQLSAHARAFVIAVNVFEDKSYELSIRDITQQENSRRLKQEMTGHIAHELRTPITSIRGYLETLLHHQGELGQDRAQGFVQRALQQTLHLSQLVSDISLVHRLDEAPTTLPRETILLSELLEELLIELGRELAGEEIDISLDLPQETTIWGNRSLVYSIFRNLIENSIRYAGRGSSIRIQAHADGQGMYHFSYADTGRGVREEHHLIRIFERFYRIEGGRTRDKGGTGLGLTIVKHAVLFHQGSIVARNRPSGGLEFVFQLPAHPHQEGSDDTQKNDTPSRD